jgi:hypothetical protein
MDSVAVWCLVSVLLPCTIQTGEACIPGLLSLEDLQAVQQTDIQPAEPDRQWIFPSLQFSCTVNLTGWVFTETSEDVVCPTLQLWDNFTATTSITTDFRLRASLTPDSFTDPTIVSQFVYSCTLKTPIVVDVGTVLGFLTRSPSETVPKSNVMFLQSGNLVGYSIGLLSAATIFNTAALQTLMFSGITPLITPIMADEPSQTTTTDETPTTQQPASTSVKTDDQPSPEPSTSLLPVTNSLTAISESPPSNKRSRSKSDNVPPVVLGMIVTAVTILVIAAVVLLLVILLVVRHKRSSPEKTSTVEKDTEDPSYKLTRVKSINNYASTPIYEDVSGIDPKVSSEEHDYDFIRSVSVRHGEPEKYEIPKSSPSSSQNGSEHENTEDLIYETPLDTSGPVEGNTSVVEIGYDTPVDTQTVPSKKGERGYGTPMDAQILIVNRNTDVKDSETSVDVGPPQLDNSGVYEDLDFAS